MAQYKDNVTYSNDSRFDEEFSPGASASHPGVYRCINCGDEIGIAKGHTLPLQNHHQHTNRSPVTWKLLMMAQQK